MGFPFTHLLLSVSLFLSKDLESCRLFPDLTEIDILRFCPYVLGRILRDIVHIHTC